MPDPTTQPAGQSSSRPPNRPPIGPTNRRRTRAEDAPAKGLLAGMRIRKKLIFLHTLFSVALTVILLVALRPAITQIVDRAERNSATLVLEQALRQSPGEAESWSSGRGASWRAGTPESLAISAEVAQRAAEQPLTPIDAGRRGVNAAFVAAVPVPGDEPRFILAQASLTEVREVVTRFYLLLVIAVLTAYGLVVIALEFFVLPQHVYGPIRRMLRADLAVQAGQTENELIPDASIPADELGEIMKSRNESIRKIRSQERALAEAFDRLELNANDLKLKNHLLERARQNLADADRLASLGMMSAGLAHELNTPLAVLKGLTERLTQDPGGLSDEQAELMHRVVLRLERLGESLLDFARVRPPESRETDLSRIVDDAMTLVRIDREARHIQLRNLVPKYTRAVCDEDRFVQVFVNLIRNAVDALKETGKGSRVEVAAKTIERDAEQWLSVSVADDGPGIAPDVLSTLFEPFVSTRLDARGTGLGLAVAEGIVREHGGVLLARNNPERSGAEFEILLPAVPGGEVVSGQGPAGRTETPRPEDETHG